MAATHLVVGASGRVGKRIVLRLREQGEAVRGMLRGGTPHTAAGELIEAGVEIVDGDLARPETLSPACTGVDTLICTATSMPQARDEGLQRIDLEGVLALVDTAETAGVRTFVYTSYSGNLEVECPLTTAKRSCENRLLNSRMRSIILRPSFFTDVWLSPMLGFNPAEAAARIFGTGEAKISYIQSEDVAEFAIASSADAPEGKTILELGGPEAVAQLEAVAIFEDLLKRKFTLEFVPLEILQAQHRSAHPLEKTFAALCIGAALGDVVTDAVPNAKRYGVTLHSVREYAESYRQRSASVA
jgi:NADH dehydrogenase